MEGARNNIKYCEVCKEDVHRSSFAKHLKSKLHETNAKIIPPTFFKEDVKPRPQPKPRVVPTLQKLARAKINPSNCWKKSWKKRLLNR